MQSIQKCVSWVAIVVASSSLAHAGVIIVGGASPAFADIPEAVAAAVDGDVLLVRDGWYSAFTIDNKAISIIADTAATISIDSTCTVRNLQAGKTVVLAGLSIRDTFQGHSLTLTNNAGRLRVESMFASTVGYPLGNTFPPVNVSSCADVAFVSCTMAGPNGVGSTMGYGSEALPGIVAAGSKVTLYQCTLSGGHGRPGYLDAMYFPRPGRPGAEAFSGVDVTLFARGSTFSGGKGGNGINGGGPPPSCSSPYSFPTAGGVGGAGLKLQGALSSGQLNETVATGGIGGLGGSDPCGNQIPQSPSGPDISAPPGSVAMLPGPVIRFSVPQPAREGQNLALHFEGPVGASVVLLVGNGGAGYLNVPALRGVLLIQPPLRRLALGTIPPSGVLDVNLPVPLDLGPGVQANVVHTQPVFIDAQGSHLAAPGVVVMLDSAF